MNQIILFLKSNLKRNTAALLIAVAFSILLCVIFYSMGKSFAGYDVKVMKVAIIDQDESSISIDFKRFLKEELNIRLEEGTDYEIFSNQLIERKISAIIEIPEGYEKEGIAHGRLSNVVTTTLDDYENAAFLKTYIQLYFSSLNLMVSASEKDEEAFRKLFQEYPAHGKEVELQSGYTPDREKDGAQTGLSQAAGFFTMMLMILSLCIAFVVLEDRQSGVFSRIQIAPVKSGNYIIGTSLFAIASCLLIIMIFCSFLWLGHYPIGVPIVYLVVFMSLFAIFMIGLALAAALFLHTKNAVMSFIIIFGSVGPILGGAYFPVDMSPELIQRLSKITPHYWMMQGIKDLMEKPDTDIRVNIVILALFAILSFLITAVKFVQKQESRI